MRIDLLDELGQYILSGDESWSAVKQRAGYENGWFIPEFVELAVSGIARQFLQKDILAAWAASYHLDASASAQKEIGIVMAGNIPLVGFHDWLCVFISGHRARVKVSSRDSVLIRHLVEKLSGWNNEVSQLVRFEEMLKGCDAYIATGSNNSSRYFDYYFGKYPHIIRRNRTSAAILDGTETPEELEKLADDVHLYFGLGCRNVTKLYVPAGYDFIPLLEAFKIYSYLADHHKYKNNYDYNLALHILNNQFYMTNGSLILLENESLFSPISQVHFEYWQQRGEVEKNISRDSLQTLVGHGHTPFGKSQYPAITEYADGTDTMKFLTSLPSSA